MYNRITLDNKDCGLSISGPLEQIEYSICPARMQPCSQKLIAVHTCCKGHMANAASYSSKGLIALLGSHMGKPGGHSGQHGR